MHSFLEVVPIMALTAALTLHPRQTAALFGRGDEPPRWRLRWKKPTLSRRYLATILSLVAGLSIGPNTEELLRCYRIDRTFAPHRPPNDGCDSTRI